MQKFKLFTTLALTGALAMSVLTGCGTAKDAQQQPGGTQGEPKKTLTLATSADYPPYESHEMVNGKDEIVGFDIDIAKAIAKELGYEIKIQDMDFNGLLPAMQTGRVDFVMAGMTPTDERKQNADFTMVYYEAKNTIVAKKDKGITKPEDLKGKKVGVQLGSIQEGDAKKLAEQVGGFEIKSLNRIPEIVQEIKAGRIDAAIIEDTVAKGYTANNQDLQFNTIPNAGDAGSAIAFPKGSQQVAEFNKVLQKMKDNGELDKLIKKWFEGQTK